MYATQEVADDVHGHEHEPSDDDIDGARTNLKSEGEDDIHRRTQVDDKSKTGGVNRVAEFQMWATMTKTLTPRGRMPRWIVN